MSKFFHLTFGLRKDIFILVHSQSGIEETERLLEKLKQYKARKKQEKQENAHIMG